MEHPVVWVNDAYLPYWRDDTRVQVFFGGAASGKSWFLAQRCVADVLRGRNYLVVRNVARTLRPSVFNQIVKVMGEMGVRQRFAVNRSELVITCRENGRQMLFAGLDDAEKLKSITPADGVLTDIWIEEATEVARDAYKQLTKRLRGRAGAARGAGDFGAGQGGEGPGQEQGREQGMEPEQGMGLVQELGLNQEMGTNQEMGPGRAGGFKKRIALSFNPVAKAHWIYREFFGKWDERRGVLRDEAARLLVVKSTYRDNRFLAPDDVDALEAEDDRYFHDVYTLGNWGVQGGAVFRNWETRDLAALIPTFDKIVSGLDFGFAADPNALVRAHVDMAARELYIFEEMYETGMLDDELAAALLARLGGGYVVCDASQPKSIADLRRRGVRAVPAVKGPDSVNFGVRFLQGFRLIVHVGCAQMKRELAAYRWAEDKFGNALGRPVDRDNHLIDALRYAVEELAGGGAGGAARRI